MQSSLVCAEHLQAGAVAVGKQVLWLVALTFRTFTEYGKFAFDKVAGLGNRRFLILSLGIAKRQWILDSTRKRAFSVYTETPQDRGIVHQIFGEQQYFLRHEWIDSVHKKSGINPASDPFLIVDIGGHIGLSALYFSIVFPQAKIVALEPSLRNFRLAQRNIKGRGIDFRNVAVASVSGRAEIINPGATGEAFKAELVETGGVEAVTVQSILDSVDLSQYPPLIIKIDIEGGEAELFSQKTEWVERFPLLIIEPHDYFLTDQGSSAGLQASLLGKGKNIVISGENLLFF